MSPRRSLFAALCVASCTGGGAYAGPYSPAAGQPGSDAVANTSPSILGWASGYQNLVRGPQDIANPTGPAASFGDGTEALGPAEGNSFNVVSLGDGGQITLTFSNGISNGPGADFAVFENSFDGNFLELGFVDVSSDGTHFFRFPAVSLTQTTTQVGTFGTLDPTNLHDLAGSYIAGFGTPFDLQELKGVSPLLDVNNVQYVRVTDVVGSIDPALGTRDSLGNMVNDPYPTAFASGGFDLDGVGVINSAPEPTLGLILGVAASLLRRRQSRNH